MKELEDRERRVVESIRLALGPGPKATMACLMRLDEVVPFLVKENQERQDLEGQLGLSIESQGEDHSQSNYESKKDWWHSDPILAPLLKRASALGLDAGNDTVILLERAAIQHVLRSHQDASVRKAVYKRGVEPRKLTLLRLRRELAEVR